MVVVAKSVAAAIGGAERLGFGTSLLMDVSLALECSGSPRSDLIGAAGSNSRRSKLARSGHSTEATLPNSRFYTLLQ